MKAGLLIVSISVAAAVAVTVAGVSVNSGWERIFVLPGRLALRAFNLERGVAPEYAVLGLTVNIAFFTALFVAVGTLLLIRIRRGSASGIRGV